LKQMYFAQIYITVANCEARCHRKITHSWL